MSKYFLLLFLIFSLNTFSKTADIKAIDEIIHKNAAVKADSSAIKKYTFSIQKINSFKADKDFIYIENEIENQLTWWDKLWRYLWYLINKALKSADGGYALGYFWIVTGIAAIVFTFLKLMDINILKFITKDSKPIEFNENLENIHEINFEKEINSAISVGNYRLAIRLLYLNSLKKLNDKQLIHWEPSKTNQTYINEIVDSNKKQGLQILTLRFEYAWYGDFPVNEQSFRQINKSFVDFNQQL